MEHTAAESRGINRSGIPLKESDLLFRQTGPPLSARYVLEVCNVEGCNGSTPIDVMLGATQAIGYIKASNNGTADFFGKNVAVSRDGYVIAIGAPQEDSTAVGIDGNQNDDNAPDSGAVYVYRYDFLTDSWYQDAYIKASNTNAGDQFGHSLALDAYGNRLVVGAPYEDSNSTSVNGNQNDNNAADSGAVYLFWYNSTTKIWSQEAYIKASDIKTDDRFGWSVSIDENGYRVAVGAPFFTQTTTRYYEGRAYIFERNSGIWSESAKIMPGGLDGGDNFGYSVSIDSNAVKLVVGAPGESSDSKGVGGVAINNYALRSGAVYVFYRTASTDTWDLTYTYIKASNTDAEDKFGYSVAISNGGTGFVVGAPYEDSSAKGLNGNQNDNSAVDSGAAYLFRYNPNAYGLWEQELYIKASNAEMGDHFGEAVSIDAGPSNLLISAPYEDSSARGVNGNQDDNSKTSAGAAYFYIYNYSTNTWSQKSYLKASNTNYNNDCFGLSVALINWTGKTAVIGAKYENGDGTGFDAWPFSFTSTNSGAAYLY